MQYIYDFYITPEEYDIAASNGISKQTLEERIRRLAWDKSEAMTKPVKNQNSIKEWISLANKNGISLRTFEERIYTKKWSYEVAATTPILDRKAIVENMVNKRRRFPKHILKLAEKNNVPYDTFRARVNKLGMTFEEAATMPVMTRREIGLLSKDKRKKDLDLIFAKTKTYRKRASV